MGLGDPRPWVDQLVQGLVHPSPGLVVLVLAVILSGRAGETALAICLVLVIT